MADSIRDNIGRVRDRMARAARRAGRPPDMVTLIAVTKTVAPNRIVEAYEAGAREFGENYVQEALAKRAEAVLQWPDARWHFIGHLQSNKARQIVDEFALIQSVDSLSLAKEIGKRARQAATIARILLEVKIDPADTKFGFAPETTLEAAAQIAELPGIALSGLMGMAPYSVEAENARLPFRRLAALYHALPETQRHILSMGMTNDFEVAIEEGATHIRIGTAIFGTRQ